MSAQAQKSSLLSRIRRAPEPEYAPDDMLFEPESELVERGWQVRAPRAVGNPPPWPSPAPP